MANKINIIGRDILFDGDLVARISGRILPTVEGKFRETLLAEDPEESPEDPEESPCETCPWHDEATD
jgi:hypothetical protein